MRFYHFCFFKSSKGFSLSKNEMQTRNQGLKGIIWPLPASPAPSPPLSQASVLLQWSPCCASNVPDACPSGDFDTERPAARHSLLPDLCLIQVITRKPLHRTSLRPTSLSTSQSLFYNPALFFHTTHPYLK